MEVKPGGDSEAVEQSGRQQEGEIGGSRGGAPQRRARRALSVAAARSSGDVRAVSCLLKSVTHKRGCASYSRD